MDLSLPGQARARQAPVPACPQNAGTVIPPSLLMQETILGETVGTKQPLNDLWISAKHGIESLGLENYLKSVYVTRD